MTLKKDLSLFKTESQKLNPYEQYFLLENPFPGYGDTGFDVCTDQDNIKQDFVYILRNFSSGTKRLRINGENGAGKTNILQYFERLTDEARRSKFIKNLYPIYVNAPEESYFDIHKQIVDKLAELVLGDLLEILQSTPKKIDKLSKEIRSASELLEAIKALVGRSDTLFTIYGDRHEDAFVRWLKGQKLTAADKKLLTLNGTPPIDITSPSLAMRFLHGLLLVLKKLNLCDGIILLFDEFEEIFEGLSRSRQSRYAQDLRHLFDTLNETVFFVIATTPNPGDLAQYPAIERRLDEPVELQPIDTLELAINYVMDYFNSGRDKYSVYTKDSEKQLQQSRPDGLEPLTQEAVEEEYLSLKQNAEAAGFDVLPGYFLPRMRELLKQKVESSSS